MNWNSIPGPLRRLAASALAAGALAGLAPSATASTVTSSGDLWVRLQESGSTLGLRYSIPARKELRLSGARTFAFETDSRQLRVDGVRVWMNAPTAKIGRHWMVTQTDLNAVLTPLARPAAALRGARIGVITIDPGHGGKDTGAIGAGGTREKNLTLNVAKRVAARLKQAGLAVRMTRESDRALELEDRCVIARQQGCGLFVSLHFNAAASRVASGVEVHVLSSAGYGSTAVKPRRVGRRTAWAGHRHAAGSLLLAYQVQKAMVTRLGETDRGVRRSNFAVLRDASFPAILVECGFLSHSATEKKLKTDAQLDRIAAAITEGILAHVRAVKAAQLTK